MFKKSLNNNAPDRKSGETLLEVLIALVVLIIGSVTATSLIIMAIQANIYNKDSLVALNLAQEGLEYMRNVRDGNWIKFSANPQGCWNMRPGTITCAPASALPEKLPSDNVAYALGDTLSDLAAKLDLADGTTDEGFRIKYFDTTAGNSDGIDRGISGLTALLDDYDFMGTTHVSGNFVANTKFYRSINIDYKTINSTTWAIGETANPSVADMMIVTSTVQWQDGGITHQTQLSSALTRYK